MDKFKKYRLRPEAFEHERSRLLRGFYAAYLLALVTVLMMGLRNLDFTPGAHFIVSLVVITISATITLSIGFWSIFRSLRLRREAWVSFELLFEEDSVLRCVSDHQDFALLRSEITGFDETEGRGFFVKTADGHRFIYIPAALQDYDGLKQRLSLWQPFGPPRKREPIWRSPFFIGAACLLAWSMLWIAPNRQYVLASAFVLMVFLLSTFITVLRSPRSSISMKRTSWIYLAIAAVALLRLVNVLRVFE